MAEPLVDVDLDALAAPPKKVRLRGKVYRLPGDLPMELFLRLQSFDQRAQGGEDEFALLGEIQDELLSLFQEYQPALKKLPPMGILELAQALPAIYGGGNPGEAPAQNRATRRQKKRTPSKPPARARRAPISR